METQKESAQSRISASKQKITPFLWFNGNIKEALDFYTRIFKNASITEIHELNDGSDKKKILTATFEIEGMKFMALDGGPHFSFTPAISFFINCETQEEVDYLWDSLSEGGRHDRCGWLVDPFGVSWQVIPSALGKLMNDPDPIKSQNVMNAMLKMDKIIISDLEEAYNKA